MGKFLNIIRTLVKEELSEMARTSDSIRILDKDKAERLKKLNSGHWSSELLDMLLSSEGGATRNEIASKLDMSPMYLNNEIKALQDNGIISRDRPEKEASDKEPGQRGRKPSDTSREGIIRILFKKFADNPDFTPTEEDITYTLPKGLGTEPLTPEQVAKIKSKALGLTKRGRPAGTGKNPESLSEVYLRLQKRK